MNRKIMFSSIENEAIKNAMLSRPSRPGVKKNPSGFVRMKEPPSYYNVWLIYDEETPREFVKLVLERFFYFSSGEAKVKSHELAVDEKTNCGRYPRDIAETKVIEVIDFSRSNNYSLKCIMSRDEDNVLKKS